ncbi:MAG: hypothetical protein IJZ46_02155 [Bacilli bacterium]|nr:hypothetical protein [Bacilli bacterium]
MNDSSVTAREGNLIGYNSQKVTELREKISAAGIDLSNRIEEFLYNQIVYPIGLVWKAPEAKTFFEEFKNRVAGLGPMITESLEQFRNSIQTAGDLWAERTGGERPDLSPSMESIEVNLNIDCIYEKDERGNVYLDANAMEDMFAKISDIASSLKYDMGSPNVFSYRDEAFENYVDDIPFLGMEQLATMQTNYSYLGSYVGKLLENMLTNGEDSLSSKILQTRQNYIDVAGDAGRIMDDAMSEEAAALRESRQN